MLFLKRVFKISWPAEGPSCSLGGAGWGVSTGWAQPVARAVGGGMLPGEGDGAAGRLSGVGWGAVLSS